MPEIIIQNIEDGGDLLVFEVKVIEGSGNETTHRVTASSDYLKRFRAEETPDLFLEKSFHFLLEREQKESILSFFDISDIQKFFPEYEEEMERFMSTH